jgi:uncharacterized protein (DUF433 family)
MEHTITLSEQTYRALQHQAARSQKTVEVLVEEWLHERLDLERFPELEWRPGVSGWRVGIRGTAIDVYTVVGYSQAGYSAQEIAEELLPRLTLDQVRAALRYYGEYPGEIDQRLAAADPEVSKARLYRELGPIGYRQLTGATQVPQIIRESRAEYTTADDDDEHDQAVPG